MSKKENSSNTELARGWMAVLAAIFDMKKRKTLTFNTYFCIFNDCLTITNKA